MMADRGAGARIGCWASSGPQPQGNAPMSQLAGGFSLISRRSPRSQLASHMPATVEALFFVLVRQQMLQMEPERPVEIECRLMCHPSYDGAAHFVRRLRASR